MKGKAIVLGLLAVLVLVIPTLAVCSDEREGDATGEKKTGPELSPFVLATGGKAGSEPTKVYTNDDLKKLSGGVTSSKPAEAAPSETGEPSEEGSTEAAPGSALDQIFAEEQARKEHAQKIVEAEKRVTASQQKLADLEKRLRAVRNPLLARPEAPEDDPEAWNNASAAERATMTETQIQAARDEVAQAEQDLAALRGGQP